MGQFSPADRTLKLFNPCKNMSAIWQHSHAQVSSRDSSRSRTLTVTGAITCWQQVIQQICGFMITDRIKGPRGEGIKVIGIIKELVGHDGRIPIPTPPWTHQALWWWAFVPIMKKRPGAKPIWHCTENRHQTHCRLQNNIPSQARFDYASCYASFTACFPASWSCTKASQAFPPKALSLAKSEPCFQSLANPETTNNVQHWSKRI